MSLSCRNVIKASDVNVKGKKVVANFTEQKLEECNEVDVKISEDLEIKLKEKEEEVDKKLQQAQVEYEEIINNARLEAQKIIDDSKSEVETIEKKAYEEGYGQGMKNGYEDGYKESYEQNIEKAKSESEEIINSANKILIESKDKVAEYMNINKANILKLSVNIAEQVLRDEFKSESAMNDLLTKVIEEYELKENIVIKTNPIYIESINNEILKLKEDHKLNGDVFVLGDESIEEGNAIVDNSKGRLIIGLDAVLDKIKEEIL